MSHINYQDDFLTIDDQNIFDLAKKVPTPFYLYSQSELEKNFQNFEGAAIDSGIKDNLTCFALKSNPNPEFVKALANQGAGADIVSGGELMRALECGISPEKIVFSGVGKTTQEITQALSCGENGIYSFNLESIEELKEISNVATSLGKTARVAFRLNPKVHVKTHKHISTGFKTHKFGILKADILKALDNQSLWQNVKLVGLSVHIGSQLTCLKATGEALLEINSLYREIRDHYKLPLEFIDVGGGLGVDYEKNKQTPSASDYMDIVASNLHDVIKDNLKIVFEPGRYIAASAGFFISSVLRTKQSEDCYFVIVDGGMNDFVRASLYDAYHEIFPIVRNSNEIVRTDVVGPICETADCFASGRMIQTLHAEDIIAIGDVGAYGHSMSSTYNMRERSKEVFLKSNGDIFVTKHVCELTTSKL